jgi:HSP20 family molecular chaperone IbpA
MRFPSSFGFLQVAPLRTAHSLFRPRMNLIPRLDSFLEHDPLFVRMRSILNDDFAHFRGFPSLRIKYSEGPKAYRIDAEVPGFRKEDLSVEFLNQRTLRITGQRRSNDEVVSELENPQCNNQTTSQQAQTLEAQDKASSETPEAGTKDVTAREADEEPQAAETDCEIRITEDVSLPDNIDMSAVKAKLDHGILSLTFPKKGGAEPSPKIVIE